MADHHPTPASLRKARNYSKQVSEDGLSKLSDKLMADLRKHIRRVNHFPSGSSAWVEVIPSLQRVAEITEMEKDLPKEHDGSTLWECEEVALRYILEDGKLNLLLRSLHDHCAHSAEASLQQESKHGEADDETDKTYKQQSRDFEHSVGVILRNAWTHAEAFQTTEHPLLFQHIALVARNAVECRPALEGDNTLDEYHENSQEVLIFEYLAIALDQMKDNIEEERCLPWARKEHAIASLVRHLSVNQDLLSQPQLETALCALSQLFETEDYSTFKKQYFPGDDSRAALVTLQPLVADLVKVNPEMKKRVRKLRDEISATKRRLSSK